MIVAGIRKNLKTFRQCGLSRPKFRREMPEFSVSEFTNALELVAYGLGMVEKLKSFLKDQTAATAIEYALIAAGISIVAVAAVNGIGTKLNTTFSSVSTQLK